LDVIFTIVSRNYAAQAATLMQSLAAAEPEARRVVVATDGPIPSLEALAEVIPAEALDAPFAAMTVYYDALELNTAVKPYAFRRLLGEAETVTYLDPDIYVFRPLAAVRAALDGAELALTPHLTRPLAGPAQPNDRTILQSGVYNLGFMAARATPKTRALVDWWAERCRFDCRVDFAAGLFTDQRWMDLAPGLVDRLAILREATLNLAYWNLEGRTLAKGADGWTVDGAPLGFFHFSGFDPARPELLSKHQDRIAVAPGSALAALLGDYAEALTRNGHAEAKDTPYAHGRFPSGAPVTRAMRQKAMAAARAGEDFADGLGGATEARLADDGGVRRAPDAAARPEVAAAPLADLAGWLTGVTADGEPRALAALRVARGDLRNRFGEDRDGLLAWALGVEAPAGRFAAELLPETVVARLAKDPEIVLRAARFAAPDATPLRQRLSAAFGLAARGRWPEAISQPLRAPLLAPAAGRPRGFPQLFEEIWRARPDLQRQFPLERRLARFRFLRWLAAGGLADHDVPLETLPPAVRDRPLLQLAIRSVGQAEPAPAVVRPRAVELWVVEDATEAREIAADRLVYEAPTGRFLGPGEPAVPRQVDLVRFLVAPELIAADAMALYARGVRWAAADRPGA
jgi:hypothetical protein